MGGFFFNVKLLGPCKSMPRSAKDLAKHAEDVAKHAEVGRGRCQACQELQSKPTHLKFPHLFY